MPTQVDELAFGVDAQFKVGTVQLPDMPGTGPVVGTTYPDQFELKDPGKGDTGVAEAVAAELVPAAFEATTENVYFVPAIRPVNTQNVFFVLMQLAGTDVGGDEETEYRTESDPPLLDGGPHVMYAS